MRTTYKYIRFLKLDREYQYDILNNNNDTLLGHIFWYRPWHQWVFTQAKENMVFSKSCLLDIIDFINQLG